MRLNLNPGADVNEWNITSIKSTPAPETCKVAARGEEQKPTGRRCRLPHGDRFVFHAHARFAERTTTTHWIAVCVVQVISLSVSTFAHGFNRSKLITGPHRTMPSRILFMVVAPMSARRTYGFSGLLRFSGCVFQAIAHDWRAPVAVVVSTRMSACAQRFSGRLRLRATNRRVVTIAIAGIARRTPIADDAVSYR